MKPLISLMATALACVPASAHAWGYQGHIIVAAVARSYLSDNTKAKIDAILATDTAPLTGAGMLSAATWADSYRTDHPETGNWHFIDLPLIAPDMSAACYGFPAQPPEASLGPAEDCIVNKLQVFTKELANPATSPAERLYALKYVLHFVGDIHQPLHASDNEDQGGNCVRLDMGEPNPTNLHSYWDTRMVRTLGPDADRIAGRIRAGITPAERASWQGGAPRAWALESHALATSITYSFKPPAGCDRARAPMTLPAGYAEQASAVVEVQLQKASVRLARVLTEALGS